MPTASLLDGAHMAVRDGLSFLADVMRAVDEAPTPEQVGLRVLEALCGLTGFELGQVWALQEPGAALRCSTGAWRAAAPVRAEPFRRASLAVRLTKGEGLPGRVWASGRPDWLTDVTADPAFVRATAAAEVGLRSGFAFPVQARGRLLAVFELFSRERRAPPPDLYRVLEPLRAHLATVFEHRSAMDITRVVDLQESIQRGERARELENPFLGRSQAMACLAEQARRVVAADSAVLIRGETGTGKGVLARWLHENGPRADEAFVDFNGAGLIPQFLASDLFGHERGAFTGATSMKPGLLEIAHRGTLFLDEIGDIEPGVQPKLLKVLEEKRFRRLGDVHDRMVEVRLIAATHQDLGELIRQRRFREDLYFRISTLTLMVPPLRERPEDIPLLAEHLLTRLGRGGVRLAEDAAEALVRYPWPGNVRELRNVLERAVLLGGGQLLRRKDLQFDALLSPPPIAVPDAGLTLKQLEQRHIERVLREEGGSVERAARRLAVPRSSLYEKLKRYGLVSSRS